MNFLRHLSVPLLAVALLFGTQSLYSAQAATQQINSAHSKKQGQVYYVCPMHPDVKYKKPGKCPKCKMSWRKELKVHARSNSHSCDCSPRCVRRRHFVFGGALAARESLGRQRDDGLLYRQERKPLPREPEIKTGRRTPAHVRSCKPRFQISSQISVRRLLRLFG